MESTIGSEMVDGQMQSLYKAGADGQFRWVVKKEKRSREVEIRKRERETS